jgi:hypothetical protein
MGYYSSITGELEPSRPLTESEVALIKEIFRKKDLDYFVYIDDYGVIDFSQGESGKFYDGDKAVKHAFELFESKIFDNDNEEDRQNPSVPLSVTYSGTLDITGEEPEDMWRIIVRENKVFTQQARIVWEDEDIEPVA